MAKARKKNRKTEDWQKGGDSITPPLKRLTLMNEWLKKIALELKNKQYLKKDIPILTQEDLDKLN